MFTVQWTLEAERDLDEILAYYLEHAGMGVAQDIYARIKAQVGSLTMFPHRCRPGRVADTKEYVITRLPYIAVVDIGEDTVYVLSVVHTARKYPLKKRLQG